MTSETIYIISSIRQQIEQNNVIFPVGFDFCFREPDTGNIFLRRMDDNAELVRFPNIDTQGNWFYLRYEELEKSTFTPINRQGSCQERFEQAITLKGVFIFTANNQYEVGDYTVNTIMGTFIPPFGTIDTIKIDPASIQYDYFNFNDEDTGNELRSYMPDIQSFAIDINVTFAREFSDCRNPPEIIT
jgi:hypothetical protein